MARFIVLAVFVSGWLGVSPQARANCNIGCGSNVTNAFLGDDAMGSNPNAVTGSEDTAVGSEALASVTSGLGNTAVGFSVLATTQRAPPTPALVTRLYL